MNAVVRTAIPDAVGLLLTRYSVSARHLQEPGPSSDDVWTMAMAALRAPDHGKKIPFRFVVSRGDGRLRLAQLFEAYALARGKDAEAIALERDRAMRAPVTIAVVARIDAADEEVPVHEQWACVGGAIANALMALHCMGYGAKMVSGVRARDAAIGAAYCQPGETLVGWIVAGTPRGPVKPRGEVDADWILHEL